MHFKIIEDIYQGKVSLSQETAKCLEDTKWGNCVTIALIKAAMVEFESIANIFLDFIENQGNIHCTFNDGVSVSINQEEINLVEEKSGIQSNEGIYYDDFIKIYTLICKRVFVTRESLTKKHCINNFTNAIEYINSGYATKNAHRLLGLKKKDIRIKNITKYKSVIAWTGAHASYVSYGIQDMFGRQKRIKNILGIRWMANPRGIGGKIRDAYILKKSL